LSEGPKPGAGRAVESFVSAGPSETEAFGMRLAEDLSAGSVVAVSGELGAGKTVLARGIARGLGVEGYLKSPSFTIVNEYREGRLPLYHIDLYRLEGGALSAELGLEEYLYGDGVCVIEWAERAPELIPKDAIRITITYGGELPCGGLTQSVDNKEETGADGATRTLLVSFNEYGEPGRSDD